MDELEPEASTVSAQEKARELMAAVNEMVRETQRLQTNLNRLHEFQTSMLSVSRHWMQWMESTNQLHPTEAKPSASPLLPVTSPEK